MTLHEAIAEVLKISGRSKTTQQIADVLNRTGAYQKRDGSEITAFQIHGRTRNYSNLFERNGTLVSLKGKLKISKTKPEKAKIMMSTTKIENDSDLSFKESEKILMKESAFKPAKNIDPIVSKKPGLYCIRIKNMNALPEPFNSELANRGHNIIYIGIASQSLNKRMLNQELRANGHGTFFRSLGAILGFMPPINSLADKKNKRNYKFSTSDESEIIDWINENLLVNWVEQSSGWDTIESALIQKYKPLLNIANNPNAMPELSKLRKECVDVANGRE